MRVGDLTFALRQVNFQPLDASGQPVMLSINDSGDPLPGAVAYDSDTGGVTFTVALPDLGTLQYSFSSIWDASGLRYVNGIFNNLGAGQYHFGQTGTLFLRNMDGGYTSYLGQHLPGEG